MKLIIDIPDNIYYAIKITQPFISGKISGKTYLQILVNSVQNGTPLPKGHGRLIDADELYDSLIFPNSLFGKAFKEILDDAPTIIEADKAESEEET